MAAKDDEVVENLVYELLRKIDNLHDKVDNKVDALEIRMCDEIRLLRRDAVERQEGHNRELKDICGRNRKP